VGLSAIMIADALGARVIGVDIKEDALALARQLGADHVLDGRRPDLLEAIGDLTSGGAHLSLDALGSQVTCRNSILSLRKRGRHVQVGLVLADESNPPLPMGRVIAHELELLGSHGMQAHAYPSMLEMILAGQLDPARLINARIPLEEASGVLEAMTGFGVTGVTVIDRF
jgi:alcohol dehydrogenase